MSRACGFDISWLDIYSQLVDCPQFRLFSSFTPYFRSIIMSTMERLPEEALRMMLNAIDNVNELAQLRLVCKRWNPLAERIMFSKQITLKSNPQALALYGHLSKNSSYGKLVRHIHFDPSERKSSWLMTALLKMIFTPDILKLTGKTRHDYIYSLIANIASESDTPFENLLSLPHQQSAFTYAYSNALISFRHSLTSVTINLTRRTPDDTLWDFVDRLGEFKNLELFDFSATIARFSDLERVLKGCTHLRSLTLRPALDQTLDSNEMSAWMQENVKQVYTLTSLRVIDECYGDLLEYLTFKYPNINKIDIDAKDRRFKYASSSSFENNMNRVLQAIKGIPERRVEVMIAHNKIFMDVLKYFRSMKCSLIIKEVCGKELLLEIDGI
ncbi:hypothetical protein MBANPS3_002805 [Mucor bainieri]